MSMWAPYAIPVVTPEGHEAYVLYVTINEIFENDEFTVVLCDSGQIRHYTSGQLKVHQNLTYGIKK